MLWDITIVLDRMELLSDALPNSRGRKNSYENINYSLNNAIVARQAILNPTQYFQPDKFDLSAISVQISQTEPAIIIFVTLFI